MAMNKFFSRMTLALLLTMAVALVTACAPAKASNGSTELNLTQVSCADEGFTGTKLAWCQNICEKGYTGATLDMWIHRWINRYRDLPQCALNE